MGQDSRKQEFTGEISIMNSSGDTKQFWNKSKWDEVEAAKATFDLYKGKKFKAFRMNETGDIGEPMDEFDPSAGSILFLVPMAGG